jgi:hypothetical protein
VNFMSALGQFDSQFGGNDSTAAVGWIARNPDLHSSASLPDACGLLDSMVTQDAGFSF